MNTIIEKIRAEIERLKNDRAFLDDNQQLAYWEGLNKVSEKLSDLEKEEKPINQYEDFRGEMREWVELMVAASFPEQDNDFISEEDYRSVIKQTARHFALWQREQMMKDGNVILSEEDFDAEKEKSIEWGYNLCKEEMMKEAVEGEVIIAGNDGYSPHADVKLPNTPYFHLGRKVKLIIVKED